MFPSLIVFLPTPFLFYGFSSCGHSLNFLYRCSHWQKINVLIFVQLLTLHRFSILTNLLLVPAPGPGNESSLRGPQLRVHFQGFTFPFSGQLGASGPAHANMLPITQPQLPESHPGRLFPGRRHGVRGLGLLAAPDWHHRSHLQHQHRWVTVLQRGLLIFQQIITFNLASKSTVGEKLLPDWNRNDFFLVEIWKYCRHTVVHLLWCSFGHQALVIFCKTFPEKHAFVSACLGFYITLTCKLFMDLILGETQLACISIFSLMLSLSTMLNKLFTQWNTWGEQTVCSLPAWTKS